MNMLPQKIWDFVTTPYGRTRLVKGFNNLLTPLLLRAAWAHRLTFARKVRFVAVVGSFGKTTATRCLLTALVGRRHKKLHSNARGSLARNILRILPFHRHAVIEVGINSIGIMAKYAKIIRPNIVVVTSIGSEHNGSLKTLDITRREKSEMVQVLKKEGLAVLNGDDPNVRWFAGRTRGNVIFFGLNAANDLYASHITMDWPNGTCFRLHVEGKTYEVRTRLFGVHMVYPILATVAVSKHEGHSVNEIVQRLKTLEPAPDRLHPVFLKNGAAILMDGMKSAYETIHTALDVLAEIPAKRKIVVLGEVTEPPKNKQSLVYREIGTRIAEVASKVYFVTHLTGYRSYKGGAVAAGFDREMLVHMKYDGFRNVIQRLKDEVGEGDVVLIKGRFEQRLLRIALALQGRTVDCQMTECRHNYMFCQFCSMLEKGWTNPTTKITARS